MTRTGVTIYIYPVSSFGIRRAGLSDVLVSRMTSSLSIFLKNSIRYFALKAIVKGRLLPVVVQASVSLPCPRSLFELEKVILSPSIAKRTILYLSWEKRDTRCRIFSIPARSMLERLAKEGGMGFRKSGNSPSIRLQRILRLYPSPRLT